MAVTVREYWGTISGTRAELQKYMSAQLTTYKGFRDKTSESAMTSVLQGLGISIISAFFKLNTAGLVAGTL